MSLLRHQSLDAWTAALNFQDVIVLTIFVAWIHDTHM